MINEGDFPVDTQRDTLELLTHTSALSRHQAASTVLFSIWHALNHKDEKALLSNAYSPQVIAVLS
ncbi:hypothetical protein SAMD00079811_28890 [Scytonema sp. HK-05]|nr:hypothetical protein NIES2130_29840 [Scytonema sp. HK-05]BAY45286.1 hypothetical protein SAMD00079811_28890 [Scytonema sp. HK-05]